MSLPPNSEDDPCGYVETADPETGEPELLAFWLPAGVGVADLGLERVLFDEVAP